MSDANDSGPFTGPGPDVVMSDAVRSLLDEGRAKVASVLAAAIAEGRERDRLAAEAAAAAYVPVRAAAEQAVGPALVPYLVDHPDAHFRRDADRHELRVEIPGFDRIDLTVRQRSGGNGGWVAGPEFSVPNWEAGRGHDGDAIARLDRHKPYTRTADPATAVALAHDSARERERIEAAAAALNAERAAALARKAAAAAKEPTPAERLAAAVVDLVRSEFPDAGE